MRTAGGSFAISQTNSAPSTRSYHARNADGPLEASPICSTVNILVIQLPLPIARGNSGWQMERQLKNQSNALRADFARLWEKPLARDQRTVVPVSPVPAVYIAYPELPPS